MQAAKSLRSFGEVNKQPSGPLMDPRVQTKCLIYFGGPEWDLTADLLVAKTRKDSMLLILST